MSILGIALPLGGLVLGAGGIALKLFAPGLVGTIEAGAVGIAKGIPPKAWLAIGIAAALVGGYFFHQHKADAALKAAYAAGTADDAAQWRTRLAQAQAAAEQWRKKAEANAAAISTDERTRHEQDLRDIHARADDQRVHGPGHAAAPACAGSGGDPGLPAAAGGHGAPGGGADAGLVGVPADDPLAIVPWNDLTARAADADANRAEALRWREWYRREADAWEKSRQSAPPPVK